MCCKELIEMDAFLMHLCCLKQERHHIMLNKREMLMAMALLLNTNFADFLRASPLAKYFNRHLFNS